MADAKEILNGKFWIVEEKGIKIGTLTLSDDKYILSDKDGTRFFDSEIQLKKKLGKDLNWREKETVKEIEYDVYNFPTSYYPHNPMYDVKRKIPLFTKSSKSRSLYCAGYYVIKFEKGWVKSFCPKLITLERNSYKGPFKTDLEAKMELSNVKSN